MSYAPLQLHLEVVHEYDDGSIEEDAVSMLSDAAPHAGYVAYRPTRNTPASSIHHSPILEYPPPLVSPTRLPTPQKQLPIIWPGVFPSSRTPSNGTRKSLHSSRGSAKTPSHSASLRLFRFNLPAFNTPPETIPQPGPSPWEDSTHVCAIADVTSEYARLADSSEPKRYVRNPRHLREPWQSGGSRRFPWRGIGSLFSILLRKSLSFHLLLGVH
jgi:hypothetical protein